MEKKEFEEMFAGLDDVEKSMLSQFMKNRDMSYSQLDAVSEYNDGDGLQVTTEDSEVWVILDSYETAERIAWDIIQEGEKYAWKEAVEEDVTEQGFDDWCEDCLITNGAFIYITSYDENIYETSGNNYPYFRVE